MTDKLALTHDQGLVKTDSFQITAEDVKKFFDKEGKCTPNEIALFLKIAQMNNLNPFKRELHLVKYGTNPMSVVTGYEVYLKRAQESQQWNGYKCWTEGEVPNMKALVEIYRKDWDKPFVHEVDYSEYVGRKGDGSVTKFWREKPKTMLKKVAISQAFRLAFPDVLGGLPYTADEMSNLEPEKISKDPIGKPAVDMPKEKVSSVVIDKEIEIEGQKVLVSSADVPDDLDMSQPAEPVSIFFEVEGKDGKKRLDAEAKLIDVKQREVGKVKKYDICDYCVENFGQKIIIQKFGKFDQAIKLGDTLHFFDIKTTEYQGEPQYTAGDLEPISFAEGGDQ